MQDPKGAWKEYKKAVLERVGDFSEVFSGLRKQKPSGDGWVAACCPFHEDHNPSFAFNRHTGRWACFSGCGKGGAMDFLMQTTGSSFKDVLLAMGDKAGVPRPSANGQRQERIEEAYVQKLAKALEANEKARAYLRDKRGLSDETVRKYQLGWDAQRGRLAIPVRDEKGRLVNIRFYSPSKQPKMLNLKGFGNTPRLYGADELAKHEGKQVILCEGELDRLVLHQNGFMAVTSTHGCASFRKEWLPLFAGKELAIGYDADEEGQAAVQGVVLPALKDSKAAAVRCLRLPLPGTKDDKDFTDLFTNPRSFSGDLLEKRCFTAQELQKLIDDTPPIDLSAFSPGAASDGKGPGLLQILDSIRDADGLKAHQRFTAVGQAVAAHLAKGGAFFYDPKACLEYLCLGGQLFILGNNRPFNALLQRLGNLNITNQEGRFVWEFLRNHARQEGSPIRSASWVYADPFAPCLYVLTHDEKGQVLRIAPGSIGLIPNGQNADKVLLNPSDRVQPIHFQPDADMRRGLSLLKEMIFDVAPCSETDRAFLLAYIPTVFLADFSGMKPILRLSGVHGSGKTSVASWISHVLYGENVGKISTSAANYTDAAKNPLVLLDNLEAKDFDRDLLNFLLTASTGIVHEKKKLYADQEIIRERANTFIVTTGIEALGKPELLSRQWEITCDPANFLRGFSESEHRMKLKASRPAVLNAIFKLISNEVLPRLDQRKTLEVAMAKQFPEHPKSRTFGCLSLILMVWDVLESVLGLPAGLDEKWLRSQHQASEETSSETNLFLQFFGLAQSAVQLSEHMGLKVDSSRGRAHFEISSIALLNLFARLARDSGLPRPFENAYQLGRRLQESIPTLQQAGWKVELRAKKVRGLWLHRFDLPEDQTNKTLNLGDDI